MKTIVYNVRMENYFLNHETFGEYLSGEYNALMENLTFELGVFDKANFNVLNVVDSMVKWGVDYEEVMEKVAGFMLENLYKPLVKNFVAEKYEGVSVEFREKHTPYFHVGGCYNIRQVNFDIKLSSTNEEHEVEEVIDEIEEYLEPYCNKKDVQASANLIWDYLMPLDIVSVYDEVISLDEYNLVVEDTATLENNKLYQELSKKEKETARTIIDHIKSLKH